MNIGAVVLAGGESSRMGRDKAWMEIEGQPLIARSVRLIRDSGITEIFISGRAYTDYSALRCPVLLDKETGSGPLAGIERALDACQAPLLLVLAVDLPRMNVEFLRKLAERCDLQTGVVPRLKMHLEPLAAIYPKRCLRIARDCLLKACLSAQDFAEACRRKRAVTIFRVPPQDARNFENWNTPFDAAGTTRRAKERPDASPPRRGLG